MHHHFLFPSIVSVIDCENFNVIKPKLIEWIYQYKKNDEGVKISNAGGWQSQSNFFEDPSFTEYKEYIWTHIEKIFKDLLDSSVYLDNMWININKKNNFNWPHVHPEAHLSGVFWIQCPQKSGLFGFESPHSFDQWKMLKFFKQVYKQDYYLADNWRVDTSLMEGKIITFPSNLRHGVSMSSSDEDRISIAFNLKIN